MLFRSTPEGGEPFRADVSAVEDVSGRLKSLSFEEVVGSATSAEDLAAYDLDRPDAITVIFTVRKKVEKKPEQEKKEGEGEAEEGEEKKPEGAADRCLDCGRPPVEGESLGWDEAGGGIRCSGHGEGPALTSSALRLLRALRRVPPEELVQLRLPAGPLAEADRALRGSILLLYGHEPNSRRFLDEVLA